VAAADDEEDAEEPDELQDANRTRPAVASAAWWIAKRLTAAVLSSVDTPRNRPAPRFDDSQ
jgi:hypothetical protein